MTVTVYSVPGFRSAMATVTESVEPLAMGLVGAKVPSLSIVTSYSVNVPGAAGPVMTKVTALSVKVFAETSTFVAGFGAERNFMRGQCQGFCKITQYPANQESVFASHSGVSDEYRYFKMRPQNKLNCRHIYQKLYTNTIW